MFLLVIEDPRLYVVPLNTEAYQWCMQDRGWNRSGHVGYNFTNNESNRRVIENYLQEADHQYTYVEV